MNFADRSALDYLVSHQLRAWPAHLRLLESSFQDRSETVLDVSEQLAAAILQLAPTNTGGLMAMCEDYRYMCEEIFMPEEIHFRRHGSYRLASFAEANAACYANPVLMSRYMNGLLLSNVMWSNHANAFAFFCNEFLPHLPPGAQHLEIGPGHGLLLYFAANCPQVASITGWDISPTSVDKTRIALQTLGAPLQPSLVLQDMFIASQPEPGAGFDSLVMSEILEHLEDPVTALRSAARAVKPGGLVYINVPANSPAPDHIFLFKGLAHVESLVREAGLAVIESRAYPMSGTSLQRAEKHKLTVTCVLIAQLPPADTTVA